MKVNYKRPNYARRRKIVLAAGCLLTAAVGYLLGRTTTPEVYIEVPSEPVYKYIQAEPEIRYEQQILYVPTTMSNAYALTAAERELVARVIAAEVRYGNLDDMIGVAQTIRDRAEHPAEELYYGPAITDVVANGHAAPYAGDISQFPMIEQAIYLVFDTGFRLFDETTTIYFTPEKSDPAEVERLRSYEYVGETTYFEFRSDKLKAE